MRYLVLAGLVLSAPTVAAQGCSQPPSQSVPDIPPNLTTVPSLPTGTQVSIAITQSGAEAQPKVPVQIGNQIFQMLMDTGSSWLILNKKAVANNPDIQLTGEYAEVTYGGGSLCGYGPIAVGPVSIGGLASKPMKFLLTESGNYGSTGTLGINTWTGMADGKLDIPMQALGVTRYEITLPATDDSTQTGQWIVNGQPTLRAADPDNVLFFDNPEPPHGNRVIVSGTLAAGSINGGVPVSLLMDTGTGGNHVTLWPKAYQSLGYDPTTQIWPYPEAPLHITLAPTQGAPTPLIATSGAVQARHVSAQTSTGTGAEGVLGHDYIRAWVMGVDQTVGASSLRLLSVADEPSENVALALFQGLAVMDAGISGSSADLAAAAKSTTPAAGRVRLRARFMVSHPLNLSRTVVTLYRLLHDKTVDREMTRHSRDGSELPTLTLYPQVGAKRGKALFRAAVDHAWRPAKLRIERQRLSGGRYVLEAQIDVAAAHLAAPEQCGDGGRVPVVTWMQLDDGAHPPVVLNRAGEWSCEWRKGRPYALRISSKPSGREVRQQTNGSQSGAGSTTLN